MATMKDVAELAGVSLGTVSRVINHAPGIKPITLAKVEAAIQQLAYVPDEYARGMKLNRTNTVALIVPTIWHPFFGEFSYYVERELSAREIKLLLCNSEGATKEVEYIKMLQQNKVDGIIAITYSSIEEYLSSNIPFVSIDRMFPGMEIACVASDNQYGAELAAQTLIEKGCQHLAFIGTHNDTANETKKRRLYFEKAVRSANKKISILDLEEPIDNLSRHIERFLTEHETIDGIFAINDFVALDTLAIIRKLQRKVPDEIQVIGYDGIRLASEREYVVSTIKQPLEQMAKKAIDMLLNIIDQKPHMQQILIPGEYIEGPTTKSNKIIEKK
ncbi:LacI family DNA-binding transcriptional regulator [Aerococcaceae bacterium zg-ZJ1578]|uniref:LacI family DNA-binding transcriptional regulator n=1 Tax=Aerococcaceae TaxID=186827 RepID=UPI0013BCAE9D|nr:MULTISPECIES: LacI family DNA-binding transcriptional regulator [unclassified Facklamia]MBK0348241.1 LacI family DNA-binding transcriptional regulator [Aerococcaceae bacterium zg-1578]NEW64216.1 LacI family DNA-binding transcriptional regulator [Facklamia sp. 252]NEW68303.1 LacI family DNA-binding transcriptional regulator [Facklamia sp. 253]QQD65922.1 LacI family DNA-binding transcriptional regulator [Aerococcaceae bacterium zg-252]